MDEPICFDCGTDRFVDPVTGHYIEYSVPGRKFCAPCYRVRIADGSEFDKRPRQQIEKHDEHAEVFAGR